MVKPETVEKVGKLLKEVQNFQIQINTLEGEEMKYRSLIIDLVLNYLREGKEIDRLEIISYLYHN